MNESIMYMQWDLNAAPVIAALLLSISMRSRSCGHMTYLPVVTTSLTIDAEATVTIPPYMERGCDVNSIDIG